MNELADALNSVFAQNAFADDNDPDLLDAALKQEFGETLLQLSSPEKSDLLDYFSKRNFSERQMSALGTILYGF